MATPNNPPHNPFGAEVTLSTRAGDVRIYRLSRLQELGLGAVDKLPFSIKVLLESCLRNTDEFQVTSKDVANLAAWNAEKVKPVELPFKPARVILQGLKTYGMIVADNGGNWFISGAPDPRWNDEELQSLRRVKGRDLEVIRMDGMVSR